MTALLRTLPKQLRRSLVPIPDRVREVLPHLDPGEPLLPALERELRRAVAVPDPAGRVAARPGARPSAGHVPGARRPAAPAGDRQGPRGAAPRRSRRRAGPASRGRPRTWSAPASPSWELGDLPRTVEVRRGGHVVTAYPALVDEGGTVGVRVVPDAGRGGPADLGRRPPAARPGGRLAGAAGGQGHRARVRGWRCSSTRTGRSPTSSRTASTPPRTS